LRVPVQPDREVLLKGGQTLLQERLLPVSAAGAYRPSMLCCSVHAPPVSLLPCPCP
ncbi:hypothetical protein NDU88_002350, partial [Pleurodeles waltl]